jgi:hypothetical protein
MGKEQVSEINQTLEDRLAIIRENLKAGSAGVMEVSGSFRVDFPSGHRVYIYAETYDHSITARFETKETDPGKRRKEVDALRAAIDREISVADIHLFQEAPALKNCFVYTARMDIDPAVFFHETIVIGGNPADAHSAVPVQEEERGGPTGIPAPGTGPSVRSPLAEDAVGQLELIDAKMLRLSLDMMNLKRSSNVRMALTRIFRDALDADELMRAIQNEAGKLTTPNDREELVMIKTINKDEALEPVIRLLCAEVFGKEPDV